MSWSYGCSYILHSLHYGKNLIEIYMKQNWHNLNYKCILMVDNGAFSAWSLGKRVISIEEYYNFIKNVNLTKTRFYK